MNKVQRFVVPSEVNSVIPFGVYEVFAEANDELYLTLNRSKPYSKTSFHEAKELEGTFVVPIPGNPIRGLYCGRPITTSMVKECRTLLLDDRESILFVARTMSNHYYFGYVKQNEGGM